MHPDTEREKSRRFEPGSPGCKDENSTYSLLNNGNTIVEMCVFQDNNNTNSLQSSQSPEWGNPKQTPLKEDFKSRLAISQPIHAPDDGLSSNKSRTLISRSQFLWSVDSATGTVKKNMMGQIKLRLQIGTIRQQKHLLLQVWVPQVQFWGGESGRSII